MNIYELFGRQAEVSANMELSLNKTLGLLRDLQSGKVKLDELIVSDSGWRVEPHPEKAPSRGD